MKPPAKIGWLRRIIHKMHGTKILVLGNHDTWRPKAYLEAGFQSVHTSLEIDYGGRKIQMVHDPAIAQPNGNLWITGHLHNNAICHNPNVAVVCVELTEYKPVLLSDIVAGCRPGT
jgi:calcineurin-like phosphoesterase family protein